MTNKMVKRLFFVAQVVNRNITDNVNLANEWYISNKGKTKDIETAISEFKQWLKRS